MASGDGDRLRVVSAANLRHKMDALVSDLSHALDESQLPQYHRKRRGYKRRAKLANNLGLSSNRGLSEDSSSSIGEVLLSQDNKSSIPLTDSDDMSPPPEQRHRTQLLTHHRPSSNLVESDSVNENFSPARPHNRSWPHPASHSSQSSPIPGGRPGQSVNIFLYRKRKCKRMALDPDVPSTSIPPGPPTNPSTLPMAKPTVAVAGLPGASSNTRKKKVLRPSLDSENRYLAVSAGKRKRGRERSVEWCSSNHLSHSKRHGSSTSHFHSLRMHRSSQPGTENNMDYDYSDEANMEHSSSESSSESETGIYTCDEGREADDEQSDWFAEPDPVYGVPGAPSSTRQRNPSNRLSWWNDEFGLSLSAKDPLQSELRLRPMTDKDRDQLKHLANLYSLNIHSNDDHTAPILTKTRNTITKQWLEVDEALACGGAFPGGLPVPLSDLKRRRRTPPPPPNNLTEGSNDSVESVSNSAGLSGGYRPPVPSVSWDDDVGDYCADSLSERLADSEPDPLPSPTSLGLHDCTL
ncbi:G patch domain-containing protein 2-like isoform X6 [Portunus trituberculatus]|uniref:G patch domain-containing protein 2-like isoform X6 n=1 Tax=Portunus trituberculatus TaxID=210409 RepID=UPI001E1CE01A|nr:G patch domain-containing protein 2-like isoform X6 [Portunus trituberculatus]